MNEKKQTQPNWRPQSTTKPRLQPEAILKMVKYVRKKCETALRQNDGDAVVRLRETNFPTDVVHFVSELLKEGGTQVTLDWTNGNHVLSLKKGI